MFASYGTPSGDCTTGFVKNDQCHANNSIEVVQASCVGKASCSIKAANTVFGQDPCHLTTKHLSVALKCSNQHTHRRHQQQTQQPVIQAWQVHYPWKNNDSFFSSSMQELNDVWNLCRNTLKVTSLDTYTDSNTRERRPYEADGYITASSRYMYVSLFRSR